MFDDQCGAHSAAQLSRQVHSSAELPRGSIELALFVSCYWFASTGRLFRAIRKLTKNPGKGT